MQLKDACQGHMWLISDQRHCPGCACVDLENRNRRKRGAENCRRNGYKSGCHCVSFITLHGHRKPCQEILDPNKCIRLALDCIDVLALVSEHSSGFSKLHSNFFSAGMAENNFLSSSSISCKQ